MISKVFTVKRNVSGKTSFRLKAVNYNTFLPVKSNKIGCFKCSDCGETDEDLAERYCGNSGCRYRK